MKSTILLNSNENTSLIEEEEKTRFVRSILETFELPIEGLWEENGSMTVENRINLGGILSTYGIQIIEDGSGILQIYCDGQIIAKWEKCEYILKRDLTAKDPKKKLYLEMQTDHWSIWENQEINAKE